MSFMTVYKIRNGQDKWSSGGISPSFSTRGKIWNSRGSLNSHLSQIGSPLYHQPNIWRFKPEDWEVFEIVVDLNDDGSTYEAKVNIYKVNDLIRAMERKAKLTKQFNNAFSDLVTRIETSGDQDTYQWAVVVQGTGWGVQPNIEALQTAIKTCKLKRNVDYRASITLHGAAVAFKNKTDAMRVRLACTGSDIKGVDIVNYLEY